VNTFPVSFFAKNQLFRSRYIGIIVQSKIYAMENDAIFPDTVINSFKTMKADEIKQILQAKINGIRWDIERKYEGQIRDLQNDIQDLQESGDSNQVVSRLQNELKDLKESQAMKERVQVMMFENGYDDPIRKGDAVMKILKAEGGNVSENGMITKPDLSDFTFGGKAILSVKELANQVFGSPGPVQPGKADQVKESPVINSNEQALQYLKNHRKGSVADQQNRSSLNGETYDQHYKRVTGNNYSGLPRN
jgi:hypothetical protein